MTAVLANNVEERMDQASFDSDISGKKNKVFVTRTQNDWYLILSVQEWELYKESYLQNSKLR